MRKRNRWKENTGTSGHEVRSMADDGLRSILKARFDAHMQRHAGILWEDVAAGFLPIRMP